MSDEDELLVDYDDTLALSNEAVIGWHNDYYGTSDVVGPNSYDLSILWNVGRDEVERRFLEYVDSIAHDKAEPLPYARESLMRLRKRYSISLLTARKLDTERRTRVWLNAVTPSTFSNLHFTGQFSMLGGARRTKGQICAVLRPRAVVEDSVYHVEDILRHAPGTRILLIETIWNQGFYHPHVERLPSWKHVADRLLI